MDLPTVRSSITWQETGKDKRTKSAPVLEAVFCQKAFLDFLNSSTVEYNTVALDLPCSSISYPARITNGVPFP
jgi:hypothetical protein